jgi:cobalt transporter subunit CbtA
VLNRIVFVALLAGAIAGLITSVLQQSLVVPLILAAETYETAAPHHHHDAQGNEADEPAAASKAEPDAPVVDLRRAAITTVATIGAAVGFALMLLAVMQALGEPVTVGSALAWGMAGFAVTGLAPALGLAPELPGAAAGDLNLRQLWWVGTALATAIALWLVLRQKSSWSVPVAAVLFVAPHIIGAPHPVILTSTVPAELAAAFTGRSLAVQAVFWALTGWFAGYFWQRGDTGVRP